jgi:zinc/manganese transport system substrate-binding protein
MKHRSVFTLATIAVASFFGLGASNAGKLKVVATTPDLASIAREIGGATVDVTALAKPTEDPHFVDAKPSFIVTLNRADMLIEGGAELELGWLPPLLENSRNSKIASGAPGRVSANEGIRMLEIPTTFDRSKGDIHSKGNPHFLTDPLNAKIVAANIESHLEQVDPANAASYKANLAKFDAQIDARLVQWKKTLAPYAGAKLVTYHKDFPYFAERFGVSIIENLEPKPGIAPSPAHVAEVIQTMKTQNAHVILVQPFQDQKTAATVARQTSAAVLMMPQQPGAIAQDTSYFNVMDHMVNTLATALAGK